MERKTAFGVMLALLLVLVPSTSLISEVRGPDPLSTALHTFLGKSKPSDHFILKPTSLRAVSPPPEGWTLLATDPDEEAGTNLKAIYGQVYSSVIYFKVEHYRPWTNITTDIDTGILIDADQNPGTGFPDGFYPGQNTTIGADYIIVVGVEGNSMWWFDPNIGFWNQTNPISLAYLDAPAYTNVFVVGVYLADMNMTGVLDCAVADPRSNWDWMPDTGHFTIIARQAWNFVFEDSYGRGTTLRINTAEKVFQFITPNKDYGVRNATFMKASSRAVIINHKDNELKLVTLGMDTQQDFCLASAWDLQTRQQYLLLDKPGPR